MLQATELMVLGGGLGCPSPHPTVGHGSSIRAGHISPARLGGTVNGSICAWCPPSAGATHEIALMGDKETLEV